MLKIARKRSFWSAEHRHVLAADQRFGCRLESVRFLCALTGPMPLNRPPNGQFSRDKQPEKQLLQSPARARALAGTVRPHGGQHRLGQRARSRRGLGRRLVGLFGAAREAPVGGPFGGHGVSERAEEADRLEAVTGMMVCCQDVSVLC